MKFRLLKPISIILALIIVFSVVPITSDAAQRTPHGYIDICTDDDNKDFVSTHMDLFETIYDGMMNHKSSIDVSEYNVSLSDYNLLHSILKSVYPELFFVDNFGYDIDDCDPIKTISVFYKYTKAVSYEKLAEFYAKADYYLGMIDDSMDDFTKILVLHDALALNNCYLTVKDGEFSSSYTFMVEGWGKCEDYTRVFAYLLVQLGIKCEVVVSTSMSHAWVRVPISVDGSGSYYNIDLTWDDPKINSVLRLDKAYHRYFLLSDEEFQKDGVSGRKKHYGYCWINDSGTEYDRCSNLRSNTNPFFYIDGKLYTLYAKNQRGYIATYDYTTDTYTNKYVINDQWKTSGNYSGFCEYNGKLCYNGANRVYAYDPVTNTSSVLFDNVLDDDSKQLYGLFVDDGILCGAVGASATTVNIPKIELNRKLVYNYNVYDEKTNTKIEKTATKNVRPKDYTVEELIELNMPGIKSTHLNYSGYTYSEDDGVLNVSITDSEKKYTVDYNGTETEHSYLDYVTLNSDEKCSFIIDGRVVAVGKSYSFFVGGDTTVTTDVPQATAAYSFINLNNVTVTDEKVELDMLATANVGEGSYQRMGVALALGEKTEAQIKSAVEAIETGSGTDNKIFVHNSTVNYPNNSGQYQFRYAPYFSKNKAIDRTIYFYTYVVTGDGVIVSECAQFDMRNLLA